MHEPSAPRQRDVDESGSVLDYEAPLGYETPLGGGSDLPIGEEMERAGGRDEESQELGGRRRRRRRRGRGRRGGSEPEGAAEAARHEEDIEPAGEDADFDYERPDEMDLEAEVPPERQPRDTRGRSQRPRRDEQAERYPPAREPGREGDRQRDSRGRRRDGRAERGEGRGYEAEPLRPEPSGRPPRSGAAPAPRGEPEDAELDAGDTYEEEQGGDVPTHKKIPTWEEAVNILIDANMAARGNADRDRGRGRGRGRR
jgi:ribonuclease E